MLLSNRFVESLFQHQLLIFAALCKAPPERFDKRLNGITAPLLTSGPLFGGRILKGFNACISACAYEAQWQGCLHLGSPWFWEVDESVGQGV